MSAVDRRALLRLGVMFAWIPVALAVGLAAHSQTAFVVAMAVGLGLSIVLRLVWR
jgi:hypothetical protein